MKKIRVNCLLAILALLCFSFTNLSAQKHHYRMHGEGNSLEHLKSSIDLSDEQVSKLEAIQESYKTQMNALKEKDFENSEDKHLAFKELMKAQKTEIEQVLTEAQKEQLQAKITEDKAQWKEHKENRKEHRTEVRDYHTNTVLPVLKTQRTKLEEKISAEDKATLAALRNKIEAARKEWKAEKKGHHMRGENGKQHNDNGTRYQGMTEEQKADKETLKALVEKYEADIETLYKEIEPQRSQWEQDIKAIHEKYQVEGESHHHSHAKEGKERHLKAMKMAHFLLLNPDAPSATASALARAELSAYPNPATDNSMLTYEVKQAGRVRITLTDEQGNSLRTLVDEYREAGSYTLEVDLSSLKNGSYYYSLTDKQGVTSKKIVLVK